MRTLLLAALLLAGCSATLPTELQQAAAEAERFDFVVRTYHHPADHVADEFLDVVIEASTTSDQLMHLWCEVLEPHGADETNTFVYRDRERQQRGAAPECAPVRTGLSPRDRGRRSAMREATVSLRATRRRSVTYRCRSKGAGRGRMA